MAPKGYKTSSVWSKDYYQKNRDDILQKVKEYAPKRKALLLSQGLCVTCGKRPIALERSKRNCSECLNRASNQAKEKYPVVKKKMIAAHKIWEDNNRDKVNSYKKNLYQKHKPQFLHDRKIARYKRRSAKGSHTLQEWMNVLKLFGNKCLWCETHENLERDHVVPISKGGTNYIHNIQPLCKTCNRRKWNKIIDFRPLGSVILDWT